MPRPTVYLTEEQQDWLDKQPSSRSKAIREAVEFYRQHGLVWFECEECAQSFKAMKGDVACPYCGDDTHHRTPGDE